MLLALQIDFLVYWNGAYVPTNDLMLRIENANAFQPSGMEFYLLGLTY